MAWIKNRKKARSVAAVTGAVVLAAVVACGAYLGDYYRADTAAMEAFAPVHEVEMQTETSGDLVFAPEGANKGLIFYPGGKVEHKAYIPLMEHLAAEGILCVLVEMPFRLAVFDINAADGIPERYPQIEHWYIGGHSLGGSMAAAYAAEHTNRFTGLVLLGSYSTADLSESGLRVLSVYGSEDGVMNREKYEANKGKLPVDFTEIILAGGCHAGFGMYGAQEGDGIPSITNEEQIIQTANALTGGF